jgi:hypothetical protein
VFTIVDNQVFSDATKRCFLSSRACLSAKRVQPIQRRELLFAWKKRVDVSSYTQNLIPTLLVLVLVLLAGCSGLPGINDSSTSLSVVNQDETAHAVVVEIGQISDALNPDYAEGRTLNGNEDVELASFSETGDYRIDVTVDGETTETPYTFENDNSQVTIGTDNNGTVTVES